VSAADVTDAFVRSKQLFAMSDEEKAGVAPYTGHVINTVGRCRLNRQNAC
jgi:hypothetical protein